MNSTREQILDKADSEVCNHFDQGRGFWGTRALLEVYDVVWGQMGYLEEQDFPYLGGQEE